jgi:hypothetical protein
MSTLNVPVAVTLPVSAGGGGVHPAGSQPLAGTR